MMKVRGTLTARTVSGIPVKKITAPNTNNHTLNNLHIFLLACGGSFFFGMMLLVVLDKNGSPSAHDILFNVNTLWLFLPVVVILALFSIKPILSKLGVFFVDTGTIRRCLGNMGNREPTIGELEDQIKTHFKVSSNSNYKKYIFRNLREKLININVNSLYGRTAQLAFRKELLDPKHSYIILNHRDYYPVTKQIITLGITPVKFIIERPTPAQVKTDYEPTPSYYMDENYSGNGPLLVLQDEEDLNLIKLSMPEIFQQLKSFIGYELLDYTDKLRNHDTTELYWSDVQTANHSYSGVAINVHSIANTSVGMTKQSMKQYAATKAVNAVQSVGRGMRKTP